nr:DUF4870 domain-containing protein [Aestuariibaculum lutulentum]
MINLSVLSFIGIPFGNLILPIIIWRNNRDSKFVDEIGRRVVNFQILFTLFLCLLLILLPFTVAKLLPNIPIMLIVLLIAYLFNIAVIIRTAIKIQHQDFDFLNGPFRLI